jgi:hypothetical protein
MVIIVTWTPEDKEEGKYNQVHVQTIISGLPGDLVLGLMSCDALAKKFFYYTLPPN